jgi:hypothetical protein
VRAVDVDRRAGREVPDARGEVAERLDRELDLLALGARGERERVIGERERRAADGEPAELAGREAKPRPRRPIWRWNCSSASWPNGAATSRKRATSANSKPIIARPVNPRATDTSVAKSWSGRLAPITANTSGDTAAPR